MITNKNLLMTDRMAQNIELYSNKVKNMHDKNAVTNMIESFSDILNETIKKKFVQSFERDDTMANLAFNETSSFNAKIETCYTFQAFGKDVRAILCQFDEIKDTFESFSDFNTRHQIKEIMRLSQSELFTLIMNLIHEKKIPNIKCSNMTELLDSLGYRGTLQFLFAVLCAALIENLLML